MTLPFPVGLASGLGENRLRITRSSLRLGVWMGSVFVEGRSHFSVGAAWVGIESRFRLESTRFRCWLGWRWLEGRFVVCVPLVGSGSASFLV